MSQLKGNLKLGIFRGMDSSCLFYFLQLKDKYFVIRFNEMLVDSIPWSFLFHDFPLKKKWLW